MIYIVRWHDDESPLDKKRKNTEKARAAVDWARHPFRGGAA